VIVQSRLSWKDRRASSVKSGRNDEKQLGDRMRRLRTIAAFPMIGVAVLTTSMAAASGKSVEISVEELRDKIRGGTLGHMLGDLNGLQHEMKYIAEPGNVQGYIPALPEGAWTDDDTDFEWVYLSEMQRTGQLIIPYDRIAGLWKEHINRKIWCANEYARQLMDLGVAPPFTGMPAFNPWSGFNISGQFVCESFGLVAPGLPRTAAKLGLHYTHVTIDGEPAQATQLFTTMISTAFFESEIDRILDAGMAALDPKSIIRQVVADVRVWHQRYPADWRATRQLIKGKYTRCGGAERDRNGCELNTAGVIGAMLYGQNDFIATATCAFNFGWDADNNAATACTIIGVLKGYRWMMAQKWDIKDIYRNTSRDNMPAVETITGFADRILALAGLAITENGGRKLKRNGEICYQIPLQAPGNVEPLTEANSQFVELRTKLRPEIESGILDGKSPAEQARAAYMAICLDWASAMSSNHPTQWVQALEALDGYPKLMWLLFFPRVPPGEALRDRAVAAGLRAPARQE
jgi:hypothetical protein